ncbi:unnamed protein product, partial [Oppiella nova]
MKMAQVFKCGSIADIINDKQSEDKSPKTSKKKKKLLNKFNEIIEENNNKLVEIKTFVAKDGDEEDVEESDDESERQTNESKKQKTLRERQLKNNEKNERTVFVGNLPQNITIKYLKKLFKNFGQIESIRLRGAVPQEEKIPKKVAVITKKFHASTDNINAYVVFKSSDDVIKALELNGSEIDGHHIRVDRAVHSVTHDSSRSIFVGNLPFVVREDQLYDTFKECGDIEAVRVVRDAKTGVGKGFGFITFKSKDSVVLALEKNEHKLNGRDLRVTRAKNESNRSKPKKERQNRKASDGHSEETVPQKERQFKKNKKSNLKPQFEGILAKKSKRK